MLNRPQGVTDLASEALGRHSLYSDTDTPLIGSPLVVTRSPHCLAGLHNPFLQKFYPVDGILKSGSHCAQKQLLGTGGERLRRWLSG